MKLRSKQNTSINLTSGERLHVLFMVDLLIIICWQNSLFLRSKS